MPQQETSQTATGIFRRIFRTLGVCLAVSVSLLCFPHWLRHIVLMSPAAPPGMWMESKQLSDDGIHSNPKGSRAIAQFAADALVQLYGNQVLK